MSQRKSISLTIALVLSVVLLGLDQLGLTAQLIINAIHVKQAPIGLDDPVWEKAKAVLVPVKGRESLGGKEGTVFTKALHTDDSVYFLLKWLDPTKSVIKQSWMFDGEKWIHLKGNEDRIALLFEV
ncbi:MAG: hypothetical protein JSU72_20875, partial [Deltaproteobacteria bacterium]